MKKKHLWIIAVFLTCVTWFIHFRYFSNPFAMTESFIWWLITTWAILVMMGVCIFPIAFISTLFLPKRTLYANRFQNALPIVIIIVQIIFIYALGSLVYGLKHGYQPVKYF